MTPEGDRMRYAVAAIAAWIIAITLVLSSL